MLFALITLLAAAAASVELGPPAPYVAGPPIESRIVGGTATDINLVPWQAAIVGQIVLEGNFYIFCGGTILSSFHILTAAVCFPFAPFIPALWVRVGSSFSNSGGTMVQAARALNHPQFSLFNQDHDISILFLASGVAIGGANVASLPLPNPASSLAVGTVVRVSGWGRMWNGGPISTQLRSIDVPVINSTVCRNRYLELRNEPYWLNVDITSNMFCAGLLDVGGQDFCDGDTGGPAVAAGVVFGVVSFTYECAHPYWPGVYAFVPPSTNWIVDNAN